MILNLDQRSLTGQGDFSLKLGSGELYLEEIVRKVPGRRLVGRGLWESQLIYAKIFIGKNHHLYATRDKNGIQLLKASGIDTPDLLYFDTLPEVSVLIIRAVQSGLSAEDVYLESDPEIRYSLAKQLMQVVAQHHNAGLIQTDIYLKNFLVTPLKIFTLDGDGIKSLASSSASRLLHNLCILLSKFEVLDLALWLPDLLDTYRRYRSEPVTLDIHRIQTKTHHIRRLVANRYAEKKVFRTCSDVKVIQNGHFLALATHFISLDLPVDAEGYDTLISRSVMLKQGNTCTVAKCWVDQLQIVIKRYNIKSKAHFLSRMLRPSRAAASWANVHRLIILGLPTPRPIALLEMRHYGLRGKAYFVSEFVDAPDIDGFLKTVSDSCVIAQMAQDLAKLLYRLYLLWMSHGDLKASNIKWSDGPVLIDLDSMRQHRFQWTARKAHIRDLKRFMQNWKGQTTLYNAFLQALTEVYADDEILRQAHLMIED